MLAALPTEGKRRAVLNQIARLTRKWGHSDKLLEALWLAEEIRERKIGPLHAVETVLYYVRGTIFETAAHS